MEVFPHLKCVNKVARVSSAKYVTSWLQGEPTLLQKSHLNRFQHLDVESHVMDNDPMQWLPFSKLQPRRPCPKQEKQAKKLKLQNIANRSLTLSRCILLPSI